jgi:phosphatidylserine/phosphatidylglycerophosphate/cardiolipin synthase-like enzyme
VLVQQTPLREALRRDLYTATDVAIATAYFLPTRRIRRQLAQAVTRGARVRLLLAGKSDVRLMQLASRSLYRHLLRAGIGSSVCHCRPWLSPMFRFLEWFV